MFKKITMLLGLAGVLLLIPLVIFAGSESQATAPDFNAARSAFAGEAVEQGNPFADIFSLAKNGRAQVVIELNDEPLALVYAREKDRGPGRAASATQAHMALVEAAQAEVAAGVLAIDKTAQELYRVQRAYNGIALDIDVAKVGQIAAIPGVRGVHALVPKTMDHTTSVPLLGAPQVWDSTGYDLTGDGISIGIIDTGIDYLHTNFGGPGFGYSSNDTTRITDLPSLLFFGSASAKVKGGYDFAGDDYDASVPSLTVPSPDPDPMDCNGHGSHVGGTAAGFGVNPNGTRYLAGYDNVPFSTLKIGPGMAPEADLYALRVFGCEGSTNLTLEAIDWALDPNGDNDMSDMLDIINMSLGSAYGTTYDPDVVASDNAAAAGLMVVAAAGNAGDTYFIHDAPAAAGRAIAVAGSVDESSVLDGFRVDSGALTGVHPAAKGIAFDWTGFTSLTGKLSYPADQSTGCDPFSAANKAIISGTITLLDWTEGECGSSTRGNNLEEAGAIGMLLADDSSVFDLSIFGSDEMPSYSLPKEIGAALSTTLGSEGTMTVTLSAQYDNSIVYRTPQFVDTVYTASSRGPRGGDVFLKPDITAVAVSVFSAASGTGTEGASFNGTSMATPHVAGLMGLLKQQHPTWTVEELKALAMNTATYDIFNGEYRSGDQYGVGRVGAGRISAPNSAGSDVVAFNAQDEGLVSVSFGAVEVMTGTVTTLEKAITVVNKGGDPVSYAVLYEPRIEKAGVSYALSSPALTLGGGASDTITVTMTADPALMDRDGLDPTVPEMIGTAFGTLPRHWLGEAGGYVMLVPTTSNFTAALSGANEVPPNSSAVGATATMTYTLLGTIAYDIQFAAPIAITAGHIHLGPAGVNGPIAVSLNVPAGTYGPATPLIGVSTPLTDVDVIQQLFTQGTYVNLHTAAYPAGEIRGQVVNLDTHLRVPVHAAPRVASDMSAAIASIDLNSGPAGSVPITLTGEGLDTDDLLSLVSAFELQIDDTQDISVTSAANDIHYVGVMNDLDAVGTITDTYVYFGIATYGDWAVPGVHGYFAVYIDSDGDGVEDYLLEHYNLGGYTSPDNNDIFLTALFDLATGDGFLGDYVNVVSAAIDTYPYNTDVIVLPIPAEFIGLTPTNTDFSYYVESIDFFNGESDVTSWAGYDVADPGVVFPLALLGPVHSDLDGDVVMADVSLPGVIGNESLGVLLLHHHNEGGSRAEVVDFALDIDRIYLPFIAK